MLQSWGHKESDMTERLKDIHSWKKKKKSSCIIYHTLLPIRLFSLSFDSNLQTCLSQGQK